MYRYCNLKKLSERFESDQENNQEFFSPRFINKVELYTLQLNRYPKVLFYHSPTGLDKGELAKSFHTANIQYFLFNGVVSIWAEEL